MVFIPLKYSTIATITFIGVIILQFWSNFVYFWSDFCTSMENILINFLERLNYYDIEKLFSACLEMYEIDKILDEWKKLTVLKIISLWTPETKVLRQNFDLDEVMEMFEHPTTHVAIMINPYHKYDISLWRFNKLNAIHIMR